jgi:hypothetical protein
MFIRCRSRPEVVNAEQTGQFRAVTRKKKREEESAVPEQWHYSEVMS